MAIENIREHLKTSIENREDCIVCLNKLDEDVEARGIIEFTDAWCWVCSACRKKVEIYDMTNYNDPADAETIGYRMRSRKYWLKLLEN